MAVIEAFEAMVTERPYKKKRSVQDAIEELKKNSGSQFDPKVIDAFIAISGEKVFQSYINFIIKPKHLSTKADR